LLGPVGAPPDPAAVLLPYPKLPTWAVAGAAAIKTATAMTRPIATFSRYPLRMIRAFRSFHGTSIGAVKIRLIQNTACSLLLAMGYSCACAAAGWVSDVNFCR
jgi:hypothetical protein